MVMLVRPVQLLKAHLPILVTELGMVMLVKLLQYAKAFSPIILTGYVVPLYLTDDGMVLLPVYTLPLYSSLPSSR